MGKARSIANLGSLGSGIGWPLRVFVMGARWAARRLRNHPVDGMALLVAAAGASAALINALWLQPGPHPAPIFAVKPPAAAPRNRTVWPHLDDQSRQAPTAEVQRSRTLRRDRIGDLITGSSRRLMAVQQALADYGYGPVKPTGELSVETRAAIEKFERERRLPVTGQLSDRVLRELSGVTGRPLN